MSAIEQQISMLVVEIAEIKSMLRKMLGDTGEETGVMETLRLAEITGADPQQVLSKYRVTRKKGGQSRRSR